VGNGIVKESGSSGSSSCCCCCCCWLSHNNFECASFFFIVIVIIVAACHLVGETKKKQFIALWGVKSEEEEGHVDGTQRISLI